MMARLFLFLLLALALRAGPQFHGVLDAAKDGVFFAIAPAPDRPARWLKMGARIDGYVLTAYRAAEGQLVLTKDGAELVVPIRKSKIRSGTTFLDEASIRALAREIMAGWEGWDLPTSKILTWYGTDWNVAAVRLIDGKKETRIISAPDGILVSAPK
jgi:hypothetical protein